VPAAVARHGWFGRAPLAVAQLFLAAAKVILLLT
jgi:hypothetical protein